MKKQKREEKLAKKLEKKTTGPDDVENMQPLDGPVPPEGAEEAEPES